MSIATDSTELTVAIAVIRNDTGLSLSSSNHGYVAKLEIIGALHVATYQFVPYRLYLAILVSSTDRFYLWWLFPPPQIKNGKNRSGNETIAICVLIIVRS